MKNEESMTTIDTPGSTGIVVFTASGLLLAAVEGGTVSGITTSSTTIYWAGIMGAFITAQQIHKFRLSARKEKNENANKAAADANEDPKVRKAIVFQDILEWVTNMMFGTVAAFLFSPAIIQYKDWHFDHSNFSMQPLIYFASGMFGAFVIPSLVACGPTVGNLATAVFEKMVAKKNGPDKKV
jgi:uncharacterized membrane protein YdcZ (DUF606 family)